MQWSLFVLIILMGQCSFSVCDHYEFHFINENKTWKDAQKYCREYYTDLAIVSNMTDMERLRNALQSHDGAWIGLYNHTNAKRMWHWSLPGVEYNESESNWDEDGLNDGENCVQTDDEEWTSDCCTKKNKFVCYDEGKPSSEKFPWIQIKMSWPRAQNYCREYHTDLISGHNQLEELKKKRKSMPFWIGLFRDTWRWSDGTNHSFRYWDLELFKDEDSKQCAMTLRNGKWSSDECNKTKPFFCYDGQCSFSVCDHYEFHFINENKTWKDAQKYCTQHHTDLAIVSNMTDMERLRNASQNHDGAWIGLYNHTDANRMWHWSLPGVEYIGREMVWNTNEPNDNVKPENCVRMNKEKLADAPCIGKHKFVCYDEGKPSSEKFSWIQIKMTWPQAQNYCRERHTDLVSGHEQLEELNKIRDDEDLWIGLFRDSWRWSDGTNHSFRYWDLELFKDEDSKKCAMTLRNGKWSSDECNKTKPFFCYDDKVILIKKSMTWEDALNYCRENYCDLVSITNAEQQKRVQEKAKKATTTHVWLGLCYTCVMDLWFWVNDNAVCYNNWASEIKKESCKMAAAMSREEGYKWFKKAKTDKFNFICAVK